jgi:hypothetical protein
MPIFTFMGSNIFHRDDVYSFRVVQKVRPLIFFVASINLFFQTIESIAPVMISSLKESNKEPLRLWISARQFLHVFSDAANHVPRHRRTQYVEVTDVQETNSLFVSASSAIWSRFLALTSSSLQCACFLSTRSRIGRRSKLLTMRRRL